MPLDEKTMNRRIYSPSSSPVLKSTADEFGKHSQTGRMPESVGLADGGEVCPHCEGSGFALGGVVPEQSSLNWTPEAEGSEERQRRLADQQRASSPAYYNFSDGGEADEKKRMFTRALKRNRGGGF